MFRRDNKKIYNNSELPDVALIGFPYETLAIKNKGCGDTVTIRKELYGLNYIFKNIYIDDWGDIIHGLSLKNAQIALHEVLIFCFQNKIIPIVFGGSHEILSTIFAALLSAKKGIITAILDSTIDLSEEEDYHHLAFLDKILKNPSNIGTIFMGYQSYRSDIKFLDNYTQTPIEAARLGLIRSNLQLAEVLYRNCHISSTDMSVVRKSDSPGCAYASPNGLFGEEFCQLARYAGLSDNTLVYHLAEANTKDDPTGMTAQLAAQYIWHLLEGINNRYKDYPIREISTYEKSIVLHADTNLEIVFYSNPQNNRWWMEVPWGEKNKIIACSREDFLQAKQNKIPERYLKWAHWRP